MTLPITVNDAPPAAACAEVDAGLGAFNEQAAPLHQVRPVACTAEGPDGALVGGAIGRRWGPCCELQQLWVSPAVQKQGIGRRLMAAFEAQAAAHGCSHVFLETFSFQAPDFYRALGYMPAYENRLYPHGIAKFHMVKALLPQAECRNLEP